MAEAGDLQAGLRQLEDMDMSLVKSFQPWWVAKAYLLSLSDTRQQEAAEEAFQIAIGLTSQSRLKTHLQLMRAPMATSTSPTYGRSNSSMEGRSDYDESPVMAMRAAASLSL
jgi:predicted RNA polymerase sigma factor